MLLVIATLLAQISAANVLTALLPVGTETATAGRSCARSTFQIGYSNIGSPQNDHSTDVINGWQVLSDNAFSGWITKTRNGKYYYLNPLGFDKYQEITSDNVLEIQTNKKLTFVGCFKADYTEF